MIRAACVLLLTTSAAMSQVMIPTPLSHLDCFIDLAGEMQCPLVRPYKAEPKEKQPPSCRKFRTYNPKTQSYRSYSGKIKPCK